MNSSYQFFEELITRVEEMQRKVNQLREIVKHRIQETAARLEKRETNIDLDILQVVPLAGLHKQGSDFFGTIEDSIDAPRFNFTNRFSQFIDQSVKFLIDL